MASNNGYFVTASDTKAAIQDSNRTQAGYDTWRQLYGAIDLNKQQKLSALKYDYDKAVGDAYAQAFASKQQIANSNYIDSYKEELARRIDDTLEQAYGSYLQNYAKGTESLENEAAGYRSNITNALDEQAKNTSNLINKVYDYLQYTYDNYYNDPTAKAQLERNGMDFSKFEYDRFLKDELDAQGNSTGRKILKTMDELAAGDKNVSGIFTTDESGNLRLNDAGIDYFDYLMNSDNSVYGLSTFGSWLRNEDSELYDWYTSENPYNYATDKLGRNTNAASLKQLLGLNPTESEYKINEHLFDKTIDKTANKIKDMSRVKDMSSINEFTATKEEIQSMKDKGYYTDDTYNKLMADLTKTENNVYRSVLTKKTTASAAVERNRPYDVSNYTIKFTDGANKILGNNSITVVQGPLVQAPTTAKSFDNGQVFLYNGKAYVYVGDGKMFKVNGAKSYDSKLKTLLNNTVYDLK